MKYFKKLGLIMFLLNSVLNLELMIELIVYTGDTCINSILKYLSGRIFIFIQKYFLFGC